MAVSTSRRLLDSLRCGAWSVSHWMARHPWLVALLAFAFVLRASTIPSGLPIGHGHGLHPDEQKYLAPAVQFLKFYGSTRPFPLYGTSLQYLLGPLLAPLYVAAKLLGVEQLYQIVALLLCRTVVVATGALTVLLTYRMTGLLTDKATAWIAASLVAVAPYHVLNSAWFTIDVPMSALLAVNALLLLRLRSDQRPRNWILLGAGIGFMAGTKLSSLVFLVIPLTMLLTGWLSFPDRRQACRQAALLAITGLLTFAVLNPQFFLGFEKFAARVARDKDDFWDRVDPGSFSRAAWIQLESYSKGVGLLVTVLFPAGLLLSALRDWRFALPWIAFLACYSLFFRHYMLARYTIFVTPLVCMFAAIAIRSVGHSFRPRGRLMVPVITGLVVCASLLAAVAGITARIWDPRITASRYISEHYAPGTRVAFSIDSEDYAGTHRWRFPRLDTSVYPETFIWESPDLVVTSAHAFAPIEAALESEHIDDQYNWDPQHNDWWYRYSPPSPRMLAFYDEMLNGYSYTLVASFERPLRMLPAAEFSGGEIRVYERLRGGPGR